MDGRQQFQRFAPYKSYPKAIPDENGLYDMYGGVAEMCADWRKVTEDKAKQYEALDPRALITKMLRCLLLVWGIWMPPLIWRVMKSDG